MLLTIDYFFVIIFDDNKCNNIREYYYQFRGESAAH